MSLRRGDFALVYFPHSDLRTVKLRPVLVVQAEGLVSREGVEWETVAP